MLTLGSLNAGAGDVGVLANNGAVIDGGDLDVDVVAGDVRLEGAVTVGSSSNKIDLSVDNLSAFANNGIYLDNAGHYVTPPPFAESMYDRRLQAQGLGGEIDVVHPE